MIVIIPKGKVLKCNIGGWKWEGPQELDLSKFSGNKAFKFKSHYEDGTPLKYKKTKKQPKIEEVKEVVEEIPESEEE